MRSRVDHSSPIRLLAAAFALAAAAGCTTTTFDPFVVPEEELRARVKSVALRPISVPSYLADPVELNEDVEAWVTARLTGGGYRVIPSHVWRDAWAVAASDVGDVFDPITGEADDERWQATRDAVFRELESEHGADAVLFVFVTVEGSLRASRFGVCGGASQPYYWPGSEPWGVPVYLLGSCVHAVLDDMDQRRMYGIRTTVDALETYHDQTHAIRPREELFSDERLGDALELTIRRLVGDGRPPDHPFSRTSKRRK